MDARASNSIHAVVTDPPYGLKEYTHDEKEKLRKGSGGIWRIPPSTMAVLGVHCHALPFYLSRSLVTSAASFRNLPSDRLGPGTRRPPVHRY